MRKFTVATAILLILFVAIGLFLPDDARIERSVRVAAPLEAVFRQVNDLHNHVKWNPWKLSDPDLVIKQGAIHQGVGASYQWQSSGSGEGSLEIIESIPFSLIRTKLDFGPNGKGQGLWTFQAEDGMVEVRWVLDLKAGNVVGRYTGLIIDRVLGHQIQQGLEALREQAEHSVHTAVGP